MLEKGIIISYIATPIFYFIYSIVCYKKKKVVYSIDNKLKKEFFVLNNKYYDIQLLFSAVVCVLLIIESIILIPRCFELDFSKFVIVYLVTFWGINYLLKWISFKKKYAKLIDL